MIYTGMHTHTPCLLRALVGLADVPMIGDAEGMRGGTTSGEEQPRRPAWESSGSPLPGAGSPTRPFLSPIPPHLFIVSF